MKTNPMLLPFSAVMVLLACEGPRKAAPAPTASPAESPTVPTQTVSKGNPDSLFLYLERTPCFGACKAYRIEVFTSGFATFNGRGNMEKEGPHTGRVGADTLRIILAKAQELGFQDMQDKYDAEVTDLPSTILRIAMNGKPKQVMGRVGQPAAFKQLVAYIEELLLPVPWKPVKPVD